MATERPVTFEARHAATGEVLAAVDVLMPDMPRDAMLVFFEPIASSLIDQLRRKGHPIPPEGVDYYQRPADGN